MKGRNIQTIVLLAGFAVAAVTRAEVVQSDAGCGVLETEQTASAAELLFRHGDRVDWHELTRAANGCGKLERAECVGLLIKLLHSELSAPVLRLIPTEGGSGHRNPSADDCTRPMHRCLVLFNGCMPVAGFLAWQLLSVEPPATESTGEMLEAIRRKNLWVTPIAIQALAHFQGVEALPYETALLDDSDVICRWEGFKGLRELGALGRPAVPKLIHLLEEGDWHDRQDAAHTLEALGDAAAIEPLRRTLGRPPVSAQVAAADALVSFGDRAAVAVPDLTALARTHWSPEVREHGAAAASAITGRPVQPLKTPCMLELKHVGGAWVGKVGKKEVSLPEITQVPRKASGACVGVATDDFTSILEPVGDTCILGSSHGEFGGSLVAVQGGTRKTLRETWYLNPYKLLRIGDDLLVLEGMLHVGSTGALTRLQRSSNGTWSAEPVLELPGAPLAARVQPNNGLLVLTGRDQLDTPPTCSKTPDVNALIRIDAGNRVENVPGP